nr:hypothetical protein [Curtobacterium sp. MCPF17_001]
MHGGRGDGDGRHVGGEVYVAPLQRHELTGPDAGGEQHVDHVRELCRPLSAAAVLAGIPSAELRAEDDDVFPADRVDDAAYGCNVLGLSDGVHGGGAVADGEREHPHQHDAAEGGGGLADVLLVGDEVPVDDGHSDLADAELPERRPDVVLDRAPVDVEGAGGLLPEQGVVPAVREDRYTRFGAEVGAVEADAVAEVLDEGVFCLLPGRPGTADLPGDAVEVAEPGRRRPVPGLAGGADASPGAEDERRAGHQARNGRRPA